LGWRHASNSETSYNINVNDNRRRAIASEGEAEGKEKVEPLDLQQIALHLPISG
jgi:hypothetical protein